MNKPSCQRTMVKSTAPPKEMFLHTTSPRTEMVEETGPSRGQWKLQTNYILTKGTYQDAYSKGVQNIRAQPVPRHDQGGPDQAVRVPHGRLQVQGTDQGTPDARGRPEKEHHTVAESDGHKLATKPRELRPSRLPHPERCIPSIVNLHSTMHYQTRRGNKGTSPLLTAADRYKLENPGTVTTPIVLNKTTRDIINLPSLLHYQPWYDGMYRINYNGDKWHLLNSTEYMIARRGNVNHSGPEALRNAERCKGP